MIYKFLIVFLLKQVLGSSECIKSKFTATSGLVKSAAKSNASCYNYTINVGSKVVQLTWNSFEMDATMPTCTDGDYIEVSIGCGINRNSVSFFCSKNMKMKPHTIYSYDGCIDIVHRKNGKSLHDNYFSAYYSTHSQNVSWGPTTCSSFSANQFTSGLIISPSWPLTYRSSISKCKWSVNTGDTMDIIKLNIMDLDIYQEGSSCNDKLLIKGIKSPKKWNFCRNNKPFSIITDYYNLEVQMNILNYERLTSNRGFVIGITAWKSKAFIKIFLNTNIRNYVLPAIFVVVAVIIIIVYRYIRSRRISRSNQNITPQYSAVPNSGADTIDLNIPSNPEAYDSKQSFNPSPYPVQQAYPPCEDGLKQPLIYPPAQQYQAPIQQYPGPPLQYPAPFQPYLAAPPHQFPPLQQNTGVIEPPPPPYPGI
ncbi:uncharacterized protein LOC101239122 isoform X1 [Hydra vulgaris]|uniref:uncharacterized protein LOC101239122 isoform X1 n=1 Tax=Hydra vulgaris TaxID=6087 RepID=UPI0002B475B0|nr:uncharacterized protein LOC101239122 isoform X1 [Hydra vulgaris]